MLIDIDDFAGEKLGVIAGFGHILDDRIDEIKANQFELFWRLNKFITSSFNTRKITSYVPQKSPLQCN